MHARVALLRNTAAAARCRNFFYPAVDFVSTDVRGGTGSYAVCVVFSPMMVSVMKHQLAVISACLVFYESRTGGDVSGME